MPSLLLPGKSEFSHYYRLFYFSMYTHEYINIHMRFFNVFSPAYLLYQSKLPHAMSALRLYIDIYIYIYIYIFLVFQFYLNHYPCSKVKM